MKRGSDVSIFDKLGIYDEAVRQCHICRHGTGHRLSVDSGWSLCMKCLTIFFCDDPHEETEVLGRWGRLDEHKCEVCGASLEVELPEWLGQSFKLNRRCSGICTHVEWNNVIGESFDFQAFVRSIVGECTND